MKKLTNKLLAIGVLVMTLCTIVSCGKDDESPAPDDGNTGELSPEIQNIIADSLVVQLEEKGMAIHKGNKPPHAEGIFLVSPFKLLSNFGPGDSYENGRIVSDYLFKIYDQVGDKAKLDFKSDGAGDIAEGGGSFISGFGNKFTLFAESAGTTRNISYTTVSILTGEITESGVDNLQYGFVMTSKKGDPFNLTMMPVGKSRVYIDEDKVSPKQDDEVFPSTDIQAKTTRSSLIGVK